MIGTLINFAAILVGGTLGLLIGGYLPTRIKEIVVVALGLMTIVLGVSAALHTANALIPLVALVIGAVAGELINIEKGVLYLGEWLKRRFARASDAENFPTVFVMASLQFCVGPLAILGAINDGLTGNYSLLAIKAVLDGFSAIIFASTFGMGVLFAGVTVLVFQGSISLLAGYLKPLLISVPAAPMSAQPRVIELSAVGGVILVGLGLNILDLKRIKVANLLPALVIAPLLVILLNLCGIPLDFGLGGH
jgi:hypothetical protein